MSQLYNVVFIAAILMQFFLYYWHGNEIIIKVRNQQEIAVCV